MQGTPARPPFIFRFEKKSPCYRRGWSFVAVAVARSPCTAWTTPTPDDDIFMRLFVNSSICQRAVQYRASANWFGSIFQNGPPYEACCLASAGGPVSYIFSSDTLCLIHVHVQRDTFVVFVVLVSSRIQTPSTMRHPGTVAVQALHDPGLRTCPAYRVASFCSFPVSAAAA